MKRYLRYCLLLYSCLTVSLVSAAVDFRHEVAAQEVIDVANWIVNTNDHIDKPFIIADKLNARVFIFDRLGHLLAAEPALLGSAKGDALSPAMGDRKLSSILPRERTTPAGRFNASFDYNLDGDIVLWLDYGSGLALHAVVTANPKEKRLQRLASQTTSDKRITYGCINVSANLYQSMVMPQFFGTSGLVYILPELKSNSLVRVFGQGIVDYVHDPITTIKVTDD